MKKYLIAFTAIVLLIGFSAFAFAKRTEPKKQITYYFFQVNSGQGSDNTLDNSQVTYLGSGTSIPQGSCDGTGYNCRVGFTSEQVELVEPGLYQLKNTPQSIATVAHPRGAQ
ncbi:MAG: hypothetical protein K2Q24_08420 [Chitinophagaceae bacterium]|jgi:uncharacterized protein YxeA|nr:hypothetical protein [Chitinophagaceae bacterium]